MATTLEELVVKIQADVGDLKKGMDEAQKATADSVSKIQKAVDGMSNESGKSLLSFQAIAQTALGVFTGEVLLKGIAAAKDAITGLFHSMVTEGVAGAQAAEDNVTRLNFALAQAGHYSKETSASIQNLAEKLQGQTKFENDAIVKTATLIESLGRLNKEGLQTATKTALDLSAALGIDLATATQLVGKAAAGEIGTFGRYGVQLTEGATRAETFSNAMRVLNERFGGAAASQVNTYSGSTAQLKNNWGDLTKELGKSLVENEAVIDVIKEANQMVQEWTEALAENKGELKALVAEGLIQAIEYSNLFVVALDSIGRTGKVVFESLLLPFKMLYAGMAALVEFSNGPLSTTWASLKYSAENFGSNVADAFRDIDKAANEQTALGKVSDTLFRLKDAASVGFEAVKSGADDTTEPVNQAKNKLDAMTASMLRMGDAGKQLATDLNAFKPGEDFKNQMEIAKIALDEHLIEVQKYNQLELSAFEKKNQAERDSLKSAREQNKIGESVYNDAIRELDNKQALERLKLDKAQKEASQKEFQERLGYASQTFGALASLTRTKNKELFEIGKAAATAQAIIDGIAAVQKAYTGTPFPFNIPLAAAMGVAAAVNVSQIQSQQLALAHGIDSVPGIGYLDQVPAMLAPGERVVPADTNRDLKNYLSGNQPQVDLLGSIDAKLSRLHAVMSASLNINIDGQAIFSVMRDQLRSGRTLA